MWNIKKYILQCSKHEVHQWISKSQSSYILFQNIFSGITKLKKNYKNEEKDNVGKNHFSYGVGRKLWVLEERACEMTCKMEGINLLNTRLT